MLSQTATQEYQQHPPLLQHSATREHLPKQKLPVLVQLPCRQAGVPQTLPAAERISKLHLMLWGGRQSPSV